MPTDHTLEKDVRTAIQNCLHTLTNVWLFSNPSGNAWVGKLIKHNGSSVILGFARRLSFGVMQPGAPDLIGFRKLLITPDMVGTDIAQFIAIEVKRPTGGRVSIEQADTIDFINRSGGFAAICTSVEQFKEFMG